MLDEHRLDVLFFGFHQCRIHLYLASLRFGLGVERANQNSRFAAAVLDHRRHEGVLDQPATQVADSLWRFAAHF